MYISFDIDQSDVEKSPYGGGKSEEANVNSTSTGRRRGRSPHVASRLENYADGRLEPAQFEAVDAHMLTCDTCFALLVALHLRRADEAAADDSA